MTSSTIKEIIEFVKEKDPNQKEYIQAVEEVLESLRPVLESDSCYVDIMKLILEPERMILFRVPWIDDNGKLQVNRGFRVQMNSALGPYKGGLRFHPSVNLSIIKFLAFEQTFKNSLTGLALGAGKGGSNFNPKKKSDKEIMRFCQSFMTELQKYIGPNTDVPAGDIGVGSREVGYLFGQYKKIRGEWTGSLTGKGLDFGGSELRPEATGYGLVYFVEECLRYNGKPVDDNEDKNKEKEDDKDSPLKDKVCLVSGKGNVAQFCAERLVQKGAKVITMSDSNGYILCKDGLSLEQINKIKKIKTKGKEVKDFAEDEDNVEYFDGKKPWSTSEKADIALPCATQNELKEEDAKNLKKIGVKLVTEGANMPSTADAIEFYEKNDIMFAPGKASNAGGVATSGLEMAQNSMRLQWSQERVDEELVKIMKDIYRRCADAAKKYGSEGNIKVGANIAGFLRLAEAMKAQGYV